MALCDMILELIGNMQAKRGTLQHIFQPWTYTGPTDDPYADLHRLSINLCKKAFCDDSDAEVRLHIKSYFYQSVSVDPLSNTIDMLRKIYSPFKDGKTGVMFTEFNYSWPDESTHKRVDDWCTYTDYFSDFVVYEEEKVGRFLNKLKLDRQYLVKEREKMLSLINAKYYPTKCSKIDFWRASAM